jgi:hypothetical protein
MQGQKHMARLRALAARLKPLRAEVVRHAKAFGDTGTAGSRPLHPRNHVGSPLASRGFVNVERAFLAASLPPALARKEPDTVAEIVESLVALGVSDTHPLIEAGRGYLVTAQRPDGGWGDKADGYGRFHTIWAAIDALRDHAWTRRRDTVRKRSR